MSDHDFSWAIKLMRAGYAGRGLTYLVVAGFSLFSIWGGGGAEGTSSAMAQLETSTWGKVALFLIFAGLVAYCIWRVTCAIYDLEDYGTDAKGMIARAGQVTTGVIHGAIGIGAAILLFTAKSDQEGSTFSKAAQAVLEWPGGQWILLFAGLCTMGAGVYYLHKSWVEGYRDNLMANEFTLNWNWALKAGVAAQGFIVLLMGWFITYAAWTADSDEAKGLEGVWEYLGGQPMGNAVVIAICLGLLGFSLFCFVNAAYRIVPKASDGGFTTLGARLKELAS